MLEKTIAALQAAEAAIQEEYEGVKGWHAQGRGVLEEAYTVVTGWRQKLEAIEPPAVAETTTPEPESTTTVTPDPLPETEVTAEAATEAGDGG